MNNRIMAVVWLVMLALLILTVKGSEPHAEYQIYTIWEKLRVFSWALATAYFSYQAGKEEKQW